MFGFKTKNSTYYMNQKDKTISGGFFGEQIVCYKNAQVIVGAPSIIDLENGDVVKTGTVREYL